MAKLTSPTLRFKLCLDHGKHERKEKDHGKHEGKEKGKEENKEQEKR